MLCIDGFVRAVPTAKREEYRAHETKWWPPLRKLGARSIAVGRGDEVPIGKQTDFLRTVDAKEDETIVLCWMPWPDKATCDAAHRQIEADMRGGRPRTCRSTARG